MDQGQEQVWSLCIDDRDVDLEGQKQKLSISIPNGEQEPEEYELFDVEDVRSPTLCDGSGPEPPSSPSSSRSSPSPVALSRTRTLPTYQPGYK